MDVQINGQSTGSLVWADVNMQVVCTRFYKSTRIGTIEGKILSVTEKGKVVVEIKPGDVRVFSPKNVTLK